MKLFDTHAHLGDAKFDAPSEHYGTLREEYLARALGEDGVGCVLTAGTTVQSSRRELDFALSHEHVYAAAGIHPEELPPEGTDESAELEALTELLRSDRVRLLGEIGLDYHWDIPREAQQRWFDMQLCLARELDIPVQIHDRDAHGDCLDMLQKHKGVRGILHSFSGSAEMARQLVNMGWYISFSGVITFKNATRMAEVVRSVPIERILVETDSPYLAPHPHRGEMNYPGYVGLTARAVAAIKELPEAEVRDITARNACEIMGLDISACM